MKKIKLQKKHIFIFITIMVVSVILALALIYQSESGWVGINLTPLITNVLLVFIVLLPIMLIVFLIVMLIRSKSSGLGKSLTGKIKPNRTKNYGNDEEEYDPDIINESGTRFYMLSKIDEEQEKYRRNDYNESITFKELCDDFRSYASNKLRLYYDISDIRKFIAGLAVSKIIIIQGISGTGKTSMAYAFGEYLDNPTTVIPVQPMWKERTDLVGYYNEFTKRFNETTLLQKIYEANYSKEIYITLLDEVNIARIEYYFAEFLSLLELPNPEKRYLDIVSDKWENDPVNLRNGQIRLAPNMWFIGTANNDDSTFSISDKVYDRAMILNLDKKSEVFHAPRKKPIHLTAERFARMSEKAQEEYEVTNRNLKRLEQLDKYLIEHFHITFGNRIRKQILTYIPIYLSCGGDELEALDDILAKKLMRKLEMQNPVYLRNASEGFCASLDELFGQDKMPQCKAYINKLVKNA